LPQKRDAATESARDDLQARLDHAARDMRHAAEENAHAFKGPIATLRASLDAVKRALPPDDERAQRAADLIDISLARLTALIDAAERLETIAADLIDRPRERLDLAAVATETLQRYRELTKARGLAVRQAISTAAFVAAPRGMLEELIGRLLDNAVDFTPAGKTIQVRVVAVPAGIELVIEDDGSGIDPGHLPHVFDRFRSFRPRRSEPAEKSERPHAGTGLCVVKCIAERLGGQVAAANRAEGGFSLRVVLPTA